jgi:hypothetical protein
MKAKNGLEKYVMTKLFTVAFNDPGLYEYPDEEVRIPYAVVPPSCLLIVPPPCLRTAPPLAFGLSHPLASSLPHLNASFADPDTTGGR